MSKQKAKIKKIVIDLNGEMLELSPAQARELRDILCDLYGESRVEHHHHDHYPYTHWHYNYPYSTTANTCGTISSSNITSDIVTLTATT